MRNFYFIPDELELVIFTILVPEKFNPQSRSKSSLNWSLMSFALLHSLFEFFLNGSITYLTSM